MKNIRKRILLSLAAIVLFTGTVALFSFRSSDDNYFEIARNIDIFATLYRELSINYVEDTDPAELVRKGLDSMLITLDPYTQYIPESELEDYRFLTTGQYGGIGALIGQRGETVIVTDPYEGFPAQKAGIMAGDKIIEIDGKSMNGKTYDEASKMLKGSANSMVTIKLERPGEAAPIIKSIQREEIRIKNVPYYGIIGNDIAYIRLGSFTDDAGLEVKSAVEDLKKKNTVKGIILDLRGNPGGLLNEAVNVVNVFVDKAQEVVSTKGKAKDLDKTYRTLNSSIDTETPLAILVSSSSASAAEIVSGSLQDLDRGIVIGQRTFGKGLVQTTRPLAYNAQLKITTSKYYIPSGRCIQALDYAHRNADGSVGKVPDSLITEFKTKKGRKVYDGGGINPDYVTSVPDFSPLATSLIANYHIFDYGTQYRQKNNSITAASEFEISDDEYNAFAKWLENKEYDYTTESERKLEDLKVQAEKEKYFDLIVKQYELAKSKLTHNKKEDLIKHREEISEFLKNEIVSRYYFQTGRIQSSFKNDTEVQMAVKALHNPVIFSSIMNRSYKE